MPAKQRPPVTGRPREDRALSGLGSDRYIKSVSYGLQLERQPQLKLFPNGFLLCEQIRSFLFQLVIVARPFKGCLPPWDTAWDTAQIALRMALTRDWRRVFWGGRRVYPTHFMCIPPWDTAWDTVRDTTEGHVPALAASRAPRLSCFRLANSSPIHVHRCRFCYAGRAHPDKRNRIRIRTQRWPADPVSYRRG